MSLPATGNVTTPTSSPVHRRAIAGAERSELGRGADLGALPRALGSAPVRGVIRQQPEDFVVAEDLPFSLSGTGEHLYLHVRKTGQNTRWVARQFARLLDLPQRAIGFAGLKDRHAVTSQWFSLHLPGQPDPDLGSLDIEGVEVIDAVRHTGKLRTGAVRGNRFRIVVRDLRGDLEALDERLRLLASESVPNYFGAQRFGLQAGNLDLLSRPGGGRDRQLRSLGLSALRSALFNLWLAARIDAGTWRTSVGGEIVFCCDDGRFRHEPTQTPADRVFPTGLLWGAGDNQATAIARSTEDEFFSRFTDTCGVLEEFDVRMMRRPLCVVVSDLEFRRTGDTLELQFSLARGQYATVAMRELGEFFDCAANPGLQQGTD